jgi:hypothetical protein
MKILDGLRRIPALQGETGMNLGNLLFLREAAERIFLVQSCGCGRPNPFFPLMCVNPRKSNVSGLFSPLRSRFCSANRPNSIRRVLSGWGLAVCLFLQGLEQ